MTDGDKKPYEAQSQVLQKEYDIALKKWREVIVLHRRVRLEKGR